MISLDDYTRSPDVILYKTSLLLRSQGGRGHLVGGLVHVTRSDQWDVSRCYAHRGLKYKEYLPYCTRLIWPQNDLPKVAIAPSSELQKKTRGADHMLWMVQGSQTWIHPELPLTHRSESMRMNECRCKPLSFRTVLLCNISVAKTNTFDAVNTWGDSCQTMSIAPWTVWLSLQNIVPDTERL